MTQLDYKNPSCLELVVLRTTIDCNQDAYAWSPLTKSILMQIMTAYSDNKTTDTFYFKDQVQENAMKKLSLKSSVIFTDKACFKAKIKKTIRRGLQLVAPLAPSANGVTTAGIVVPVNNITPGSVLNLTNVVIGSVASIIDSTTGIIESVEIVGKDEVAGTITITRNVSGFPDYVSQAFTAGSVISLGPVIGLQSDSDCSSRLSGCDVEISDKCCAEYRIAAISGCIVESPRYWDCNEEEDILGESYRDEANMEQFRKMFEQIEQQLLFGTGINTTVMSGPKVVGQKQEVNGIITYWTPQFSTITLADCCVWSAVEMVQNIVKNRRAYGETGKIVYACYAGSDFVRSFKGLQSSGNYGFTLFKPTSEVKSYFDLSGLTDLLTLESNVMTLSYGNVDLVIIEDDTVTNKVGSNKAIFIDWTGSGYVPFSMKPRTYTSIDGTVKKLPGAFIIDNVTDPIKMKDPNCPIQSEWRLNFQQIFKCPAKNYVVTMADCPLGC